VSDLSHDSPGVQGLAQLGRNAIDRVSELEREREETIRKLRDPVAVHVAMLRGEVAVPPLAELLHVYGATFSDLDAANVEIAKAREMIRQLRAQLDEYERAPTIGVIRDVGSRPYCDWKVSQATLPKSGAEIIARPARKGE